MTSAQLNALIGARETGDANAYAQLQIEIEGLAVARKYMSPDNAAKLDKDARYAREGFYTDVATLLSLESASDEGGE